MRVTANVINLFIIVIISVRSSVMKESVKRIVWRKSKWYVHVENVRRNVPVARFKK